MDLEKVFASGDIPAAVRSVVYNGEGQRLLFKPEHQPYLDAFVRYGHEFYNGNVVGFIAVATPELLQIYFEMGYLLEEDAQLEMAKKFGIDILGVFLAYDYLCEKAELYVLEKFPREDVHAYLALVAKGALMLSEEGEKKLFALRDKALVATYVNASGKFSPQGQCELVKLGVPELTDSYFLQHEPCEEAKVLLDGEA